MVALRRSPSACAGSPFGSLHTVIRPSLGYIHVAAPIGRRTAGSYGSPVPGPTRPSARSPPRPQRAPASASQLASWFTPAPLANRPPRVQVRRPSLPQTGGAAVLDGVPARQAARYVREHYPPRGRDILPAALRDQVPRDQLTPVPRDLLLFEHGETRRQQRGRFPVTQAPPLREGRAVRQ